MKYLVISMPIEGDERRKALQYPCEFIDAMKYLDVPQWIKEKFKLRYNEHKKGEDGKPMKPCYDPITNEWISLPDISKAKSRMGCFGAHMRALEHIINNKINDVVILEDDAQIDLDKLPHPLPTDFPQDAPCLLGAAFRHPKSWAKDKEWRSSVLPGILENHSTGIHNLDYDLMRFQGTFSIYYPRWEVAEDVLNKIKALGGYKHYDLFLAEHKLIPYYHYPSLFTHNDGIDGERNVIKPSSSIGIPAGIIKDYVFKGKSPEIIAKYT